MRYIVWRVSSFRWRLWRIVEEDDDKVRNVYIGETHIFFSNIRYEDGKIGCTHRNIVYKKPFIIVESPITIQLLINLFKNK